MSEEGSDSKPKTKESGPVFGAAFTQVSFGSVIGAATSTSISFLAEREKEKEENEEEEEESEQEQETKRHRDADPPALALLDSVPTGEEDEETVHQVRCKLFVMPIKQGSSPEVGWKERGTGILRVNQRADDSKTRLVMRTEGTFKLILNVGVGSILDPSIVQEKNIRMTVPLSSVEAPAGEDSPSLLLLRFKNASDALSLISYLEQPRSSDSE